MKANKTEYLLAQILLRLRYEDVSRSCKWDWWVTNGKQNRHFEEKPQDKLQINLDRNSLKTKIGIVITAVTHFMKDNIIVEKVELNHWKIECILSLED